MSTPIRLDADVSRVPLHGLASTRQREGAALATVADGALLARAGAALFRLALAVAPHVRDVVVHAGPGHNGGDGLDAAARLAATGRRVTACLHGDAARRPRDATAAFERARSAGVRVVDGCDPAAPAGLVLDALLGIGARASDDAGAPVLAHVADIARRRAHGAIVLAVDVPSGLDGERGQPVLPQAVAADHTLTFLTAKPGLFTGRGREHAGSVWWDDLGVGAGGPADAPDAWLIGRGALPAVRRTASAHKGSQGDVVVVGGVAGMAGAARLAARAALVAGAGRVWIDAVRAPSATDAPVDPAWPELMARHGWWQGAPATLRDTTVTCGCGGGEAVAAALPSLLAHVPRLVLDADALNAVARDPVLLQRIAARAAHGLATVLTPHPLEAARLLGAGTGAVQHDRLAAARVLAARANCTVVLKGSGSVVAAPATTPVVAATGNASLATAGTGDVLAGWLAGRWQAGRDAFDVAIQAVVEHGAAALDDDAGGTTAPLPASRLVERLWRLSQRA